ncbi:MAG: 3'-5' exonuclease [Deltaproteobacteria bacterium]|nr:3'-5' exonuclease [Deltaproteobacteria bacterium]
MSERTLILTRPIVSIDLETTGLDAVNDRIVEISCVKLMPHGKRDIRTHLINPGIPIKPEATAVHGISDNDVAAAPSFTSMAPSLLIFLRNCDLTGFNIEKFDLPILQHEFARANITYPENPTMVIDSRRIYTMKEARDLSAAYRFYCGAELNHAHSAQADAEAAADILVAQVARYTDLPTSVDLLYELCHPTNSDWLDPNGRIIWKDNVAVLGFGKHRHRSLQAMVDENPDYLRWMATQDFSPEVLTIIKAALEGNFPTRANHH